MRIKTKMITSTKKIFAILLLGLGVFAFVSMLTPHVASAAPFVQCGNQDGGRPQDGCQINDIFSTAARIINYMFTGAGIVAVGGIVYGGVLMVTSGGNESKVTTGKRSVFNSLIGLAIALLAILIVQTTLTVLKFEGDPKGVITDPKGVIDGAGYK